MENKPSKSAQERKEEGIIKAVIETIGDTIEAITEAIAEVCGSDQKDLHNRDNGI